MITERVSVTLWKGCTAHDLRVAAYGVLTILSHLATSLGTLKAEDWSPIWSTATLSQGRSELAAASVGEKVFFGGGKYNSYVSNVVDIYDTIAHTWSSATLSQARWQLAATSAGEMVFFGGGYGVSGFSNVVDIYDTATNTWSTATLSQARSQLAATSAGGKVFFSGGYTGSGTSNVVDIYDTATNTWSTATLSQARYNLAATVSGGEVFFGGGSSGGVSNRVDICNPTMNTWSTAALSQARSGLAAASAGGEALFGGGYLSDIVDIYNSSTNTWSSATLSQARWQLAAASAADKVIFGGGSSSNTSNGDSNIVDIYTTATNIWSTATLSQARYSLAATSSGGKAVFGGGYVGATNTYSNVVDIYNSQQYETISSSKTWALVSETLVVGRMQLNASASLDLATFDLTAGSISGDAPINLSGKTLTVGTDDTSSSYSGRITGSGHLIKTGSGTLSFTNSTLVGGMTITSNGGTLEIGDTNSYAGFSTDGTLVVVNSASMYLRSKGFADLGPLTILNLGTLEAANGFALGTGRSLRGTGSVVGKVAAAIGSTIVAEGPLVLGDAYSYAGFTSDGELATGAHTVTINDKNEAVLGSLTTLGLGEKGEGTLIAGTAVAGQTRTHFLIEQGKNLVGWGHVVGNVKNQGNVIGNGNTFPGLNQLIVFDAGWIVSGIGDFQNVLFNGTFAPGLSPGVVDGSNLAIGGTLAIELGGATPGDGLGHYDQVNDAGAFAIAAGATLALAPYGGFLPTLGEQFTIVTAAAGIAGEFAHVTVDPWFLQHGIDFTLSDTGMALLLTAVAPSLSGDFNQDGTVDAADYVVWRHGLGTTYSLADLTEWRINFGRTLDARSALDGAAIPEASGILLELIGLGAFVVCCWRKGTTP